MKKEFVCLIFSCLMVLSLLLVSCNTTPEPLPSLDTTPPSVKDEAKGEKSEYIETVNQWSSYKDVASWMKENYAFDRDRQMVIQREVLPQIQQADLEAIDQVTKEAWSTPGILQSAEETFGIKHGHCADAAQFAIDALNRINPEYNARFVFVTNSQGNPHHHVTGFTMNGEIYIMDFGAGPNWSAMNGVHGPYSTLSDYEEFLLSLDIKSFTLAGARWLPYGWPRD